MTRDRRREDKTVSVDCDETMCQSLIGQHDPCPELWLAVGGFSQKFRTHMTMHWTVAVWTLIQTGQKLQSEVQEKLKSFWFKWAGCHLTAPPPSSAQRITPSLCTSCCISSLLSPLQVSDIWLIPSGVILSRGIILSNLGSTPSQRK